eukprot:TRINITY_DN15440_c0_g1::TRINITY_DN15440_c0_g1_i1::g.30441::m.30441 TRINITY_DN15440_c0_g1::TRINITY_DN15440_c0_g1_i1::g.30441  ORF type:complete len:245 (-),score=12.34,sp/B2A3A2/RS15_NATTJ/39.47/2e-12,Ribosomal_S15/PF00312.17/7e-16,DUF3764/PF12594.3/9.2,DUF3764/PF12594.3/7.8,PGC7_Stella/PF15549.1/0.28,Vac_Fusion/PF02346.11/20,Vac_Fusion/PF02346.11/15,Vac_Fusion/PF02346.11/1e+03 TRINITY_DN15440_c0_g1_i1:38-772(-)
MASTLGLNMIPLRGFLSSPYQGLLQPFAMQVRTLMRTPLDPEVKEKIKIKRLERHKAKMLHKMQVDPIYDGRFPDDIEKAAAEARKSRNNVDKTDLMYGLKKSELSHLPNIVLEELSLKHASQSEVNRYRMLQAMDKYKAHEHDTGNMKIQVAVLSERIDRLLNHVENNKKDHLNKRVLSIMQSKRKEVLQKFKKSNEDAYYRVIRDLHIAPLPVVVGRYKLPPRNDKHLPEEAQIPRLRIKDR